MISSIEDHKTTELIQIEAKTIEGKEEEAKQRISMILL